MAWDEDAFALAVVPLEDLAQFGGWGAVKSYDGFSVRVFRQALQTIRDKSATLLPGVAWEMLREVNAIATQTLDSNP